MIRKPIDPDVKRRIKAQRASLVRRLDHSLDRPLAVLGLVWLVLLVLDFTHGLGPLLTRVEFVIWWIFVVDFLLKLVLAPDKLRYLTRNWLTAVSLAVPALRSLRALRALRLARASPGLRLLRLLSSWNRGLRALGTTMRRRGFGYVMLLTLLVLVSGAAGICAFEHGVARDGGPVDYGSALWWTAMILTTMGSEYWPRTAEGRVLCLLLALYGFTIFGYVTATLATFFVSRDTTSDGTNIALRELRTEVERLRAALPPPER